MEKNMEKYSNIGLLDQKDSRTIIQKFLLIVDKFFNMDGINHIEPIKYEF